MTLSRQLSFMSVKTPSTTRNGRKRSSRLGVLRENPTTTSRLSDVISSVVFVHQRWVWSFVRARSSLTMAAHLQCQSTGLTVKKARDLVFFVFINVVEIVSMMPQPTTAVAVDSTWLDWHELIPLSSLQVIISTIVALLNTAALSCVHFSFLWAVINNSSVACVNWVTCKKWIWENRQWSCGHAND